MNLPSISNLFPSNSHTGRAFRAFRGFGLAVIMAGLLGACQTAGPAPGHAAPAPQATARPEAAHPLISEAPGFMRLPGMTADKVPVRIGLMLPFSNGSSNTRALADAMLKAAEMGVSDSGKRDLLLMPVDEGSNPAETAAAARKLLDQGAEIIIGPLFASAVSAVAPIARDRGVPVLAFSTDRTVAGHGVYLLSFQPEDEVRAIVTYAASQGHTRFAALTPLTPYGDRVTAAFRTTVQDVKGTVSGIERFDPSSGTAVAQSAAIAKGQPDSVLIAQGGALLRGIAPTLVVNGLPPETVKYLGTGVWDDPTIAQEPALQGGWFAAPTPNAQDGFDARFQAVFGTTPPQLATLPYDAVSLVALLSAGEPYHRFTDAALTDPNGFAGVDGIFRFFPDGSDERGLAILRVAPDGFQIQQPAPATFQPVGG